MRNDFGLNDDQIMNSIKILNSGKKNQARKTWCWCRPLYASLWRKLSGKAEETQKIDKKYQKLRRPRIRKSVKQMVQEEYEDNLKEAKNLIYKMRRLILNVSAINETW